MGTSNPQSEGLYKYQNKIMEKRHMKKITAISIAAAIVMCMIPTTIGETDVVTGTFTPTSTGVSISCNKTAPTFGDIALGASAANNSFNVTNDGATNCTIVTTAGDGAGNWTLVAGTASLATTNQYCININISSAGYLDAYSQQTISSDLPPAGGGTNYTSFNLTVFVSDFTSEGVPDEQTFYTNLTAAALT